MTNEIDNVDVSKHARKQVKSRLGIPMKAVDKLAMKAWIEGKKHADFSGQMNRYLAKTYFKQSNCANSFRILNNYLFIFTPEAVLVTAYLLPENLRRKNYK